MSDEYTHIHFIFFFAFHGRLSPQISFCDPHSTVFCLFLSSFRYKPASRRKQLSSRGAWYTSPRTFPRRHSNFTMTLRKYTRINLENSPKMIKYSFYKVSTTFSNRNGTMERDFLPRPTTWETVRQTRNQDAAHAQRPVTVPLTSNDCKDFRLTLRKITVKYVPEKRKRYVRKFSCFHLFLFLLC